MELLTRKQLKQSAKEQLRGKWGNMALKSFLTMLIPGGIIGFGVILLIVGTATSLAGLGARGPIDVRFNSVFNGTVIVMLVIALILYIVAVIVALALEFGFTDACIKLRSGEVTGVGVIFERFRMLPRILMYTLIIILIALPYGIISGINAAFGTVFTSILMLAAAIAYIYIVLRVSMAVYIMLENPYTTAWTSIKQSWNMMKGHCGRYFVLSLSFIGWMLLAGLSFGIGSFWLAPYMNMTSVNFYYNLKEACLNGEQE